MHKNMLGAFNGDDKFVRIIVGMGSTRSIFHFFVEFMPKKVYHVENSYSKDVLKAF